MKYSLILLGALLLGACSPLQLDENGLSLNGPPADAELRERLEQTLRFPYLRDYLKQHGEQLYQALEQGDYQSVKEQLGSAAACDAARPFLRRLGHAPLYHLDEAGQCRSLESAEAAAQAYFLDSACHSPIVYRPPEYGRFCDELIGTGDKPSLGDAARWEADAAPVGSAPSRHWTLPYGTRLDIGAVPIGDNHQPFMKRIAYKSIEVGDGRCELEMRVYSRSPALTDQAPLLAIHGGSWKYRGLGFVGLEAQLSHLTEHGFVVFAPFYRLSGNADGPEACRRASWQAIVEDVEDALSWVRAHGHELGARRGARVSLLGQSAGGHLAAWLLSYHPEAVQRAVLMYPPTDFPAFVARVRAEGEDSPYARSLGLLSAFLGEPDLSVPTGQSDAVLARHGFPALIAPHSPAVFMLHGERDTLIPSSQSQRLCEAFDRVQGEGGVAEAGQLDARYVQATGCGHAGRFYRFPEADHMLDLACLPELNCPAGSLAGNLAVQAALQSAYRWLERGAGGHMAAAE